MRTLRQIGAATLAAAAAVCTYSFTVRDKRDSATIHPEKMPLLRPIPIETKGSSNQLVRTYAWLSNRRHWEVMEDWSANVNNAFKHVSTLACTKHVVKAVAMPIR